jgi:tRNA-splicing ligase RtcB
MAVSSSTSDLVRVDETPWEIPADSRADMRVPARVFADREQGYGFPVGGVAAMELPDGVVSPGGVGYDINCGVRLLVLPLSEPELGERREPLVHELSRAIPAGTGKRGALKLSGSSYRGHIGGRRGRHRSVRGVAHASDGRARHG